MHNTKHFEDYAAQQRKFWNTSDEQEAMFARVDTVSHGDEARFQALADTTGELLVSDIQLPSDAILLDVGCGIGRMIQQIQKRIKFGKLYGVDISKTMVDYARKNTGDDTRVSLQVNTGYDLGMIPADTIDYAYSVDVFIHIFDAEIISNYLREVYRTLKPGGYFRFDVRFFDPTSMFGNSPGGRWAKFLYQIGWKRADQHIWRPGEDAEFNGNKFRERDLREAVRAAGLNVLSTFVREEDSHLWCLSQKSESN